MKRNYHFSRLVRSAFAFSYTLLMIPALSQTVVLPSLPVGGNAFVGASFKEAAPRGFGSYHNSWAQAMIVWHDNVYVGTSRDATCTSDYALYQYIELNVSVAFANTYYPYPPSDPNLTCLPGLNLSIQAEIWRTSTTTAPSWARVYQSPAVITNPGPGYGQPAPVGAPLLPYEIAIRDFAQYTESDGTDALYAFTVNSGIMWDQTKLPPPRILRTTDGINWTPLPQDPGTFLGDLPFSTDHTSFRSAVSYNGMLFAVCGPVEGEGTLIASANPKAGDNAWFTAVSPTMQFYDLAVFNGWLYLGGYDSAGTGYQVYKTNAQGMPPYQLITVVPNAGSLTTPFPSQSVVSMYVHNSRLYVGTATFTEVLRINADDTWDLVVGTPRAVPNSGGGTTMMYPTSNLGAGFGLTFNDHAWQMDDTYGYLYIGTYNASTASRLASNPPYSGSQLYPYMGAHLYATASDWYFAPITTNGFASTSPISATAYQHPIDPDGGIFDYGIRTMATTSSGNMFVGTANDYYGLAVFEATQHPTGTFTAPTYLEIEPTPAGGALLAWQGVPSAAAYQIYRAQLLPIQLRQNPTFENSNSATGIYFPDVYVTAYSLIGTARGVTYVDTTPVAGQTYMYYVVALNLQNQSSDPSNLMTFPLLRPSVTFASLNAEIGVLNQRGRFSSPQNYQAMLSRVASAQSAAAACQINTAINLLNAQTAESLVSFPDSIDVGVLVFRLARRLQLYSVYKSSVISTEFCTAP